MLRGRDAPFGGLSLDKKLKYLEERLQLPIEEMFDWGRFKTPEAAARLRDWDHARLMRINGQRKDVVHRDVLRLSGVEELCDVAHFIQNLILSVGRLAKQKHGVYLDFGLGDGLLASPS